MQTKGNMNTKRLIKFQFSLIVALLPVLNITVCKAALVSYWDMDEESGVSAFSDLAGTNDGVAGSSGLVSGVSGIFGNAIQFDGTNQDAFTSSTTGMPFGSNSYTISYWIYNPSLESSEFHYSYGRRLTDNINGFYSEQAGNGNHLYWNSNLLVPADTFVANQWQFVVTMWDGVNRRVYVDGAKVADNQIGPDIVDDYPFRIGADDRPSLCLTGMIDDFAVWNHAVSEADIALLWNNGLGQTVKSLFPAIISESDLSTQVSERPIVSDSFSIVLMSQPSSGVDVTITPSSCDDIRIEGATSLNGSLTLSFTPHDWDIAQTVNLLAVQDHLIEPSEQVTLSIQLQSIDSSFDNKMLKPITVTVLDSPDITCPQGDITDDCVVDVEDLILLAEYWLTGPGSIADIEVSGNVNIKDLAAMASNWQSSKGPVVISEFMASNTATILDGNGESSDWIELFNMTNMPIDLDGLYLTDDKNNLTKWCFPAGTIIDAYRYLLVFASNKENTVQPYVDSLGYCHTNFSLNSNGEYLAIVDSDGQTVIHEYDPCDGQVTDISYGVYDWEYGYCTFSTPNAENSPVHKMLVADTKFSVDRGFYTDPFDVEIVCETDGAKIYYTLDGSEPTEQDSLYTGPITVSTTTCLRAVAIKSGWLSSNVDTQTYIFLDDVIRQPSNPSGLPTTWSKYTLDSYAVGAGLSGPVPADYAMNQTIVNQGPGWNGHITSIIADAFDCSGPL